ncbi:MAG TPA: hypothetical protein VLH09_03670 [Bryobacteraceae bacterium]|nr:hypothetical protein [Bryobacteraceae bacterium]
MAHRLLLVAALLLAGCATGPEWYPLPEQQRAPDPAGVGRLSSYISMKEPNADAHLLRDISHYVEGSDWRWAGARPQMRFFLGSTRNVRFLMDFSIAEATFKDTGPVIFTFLVNGSAFDKIRYAAAGVKHYEQSVPAHLLRANQENVVEIEFDKVWTSKEDGARLSILLLRAGFDHIGPYVVMNDPRADWYLLRDIDPAAQGDTWRWAGARPLMRFYLETASNLKFSLDFSIADVTFKETGPLTLSYRINGRTFDKVRYAQSGQHHYEKPVPESLLRAGRENLVEILPDKVWTSKDDGKKLSILLLRAGFTDSCHSLSTSCSARCTRWFAPRPWGRFCCGGWAFVFTGPKTTC